MSPKRASKCLDYHSNTTPGVAEQWQSSAHAKKGVDCCSCHKAAANDAATFDHYSLRIAVIVTPNYCARCHAEESAHEGRLPELPRHRLVEKFYTP
jgi:formate-dependent nitrite reductase cytochrome c552 subunit